MAHLWGDQLHGGSLKKPFRASAPAPISGKSINHNPQGSEASQTRASDENPISRNARYLSNSHSDIDNIVRRYMTRTASADISSFINQSAIPEADGRWKIQILLHWETPWDVYLSKYYPPDERLGSVMTITGGEYEAYAVSCRDFVAKQMPGISERLLLSLEEVFDCIKRDPSQTTGVLRELSDILELEDSALVSYLYTASSMEVTVIAPFEASVTIVVLLSWLSAVLQVPNSREGVVLDKEDTVHFSGVTWAVDTGRLVIEPLHPTYPHRSLCWYNMFTSVVVAQYFKIPYRKQGRGLEISLGDMFSLCRSLRFLELDQGYVVEALQNVLVLMESLPDDDGFQWHLEDKRAIDPHSGKIRRLTSTQILSNEKFRSSFKGKVDLETLRKGRNFLAWTPSANIALGTSSQLPQNFTSSGAQEPRKTRTNISSYNFGISLSHGAGIALGVTATTSLAVTRYARDAEKDLEDRLQDLEQKCIVMFDYKSKIAWYLPAANVLLYMVQVLCAYRDIRILLLDRHNVRANPPFNPAHTSENGKLSALEVIGLNLERKLLKNSSDHKEIVFADLVESICLSLEIGDQRAVDAWDAAIKHRRAAPKCIVGFELMELVKEESVLKVKEEVVKKPWAYLAQDSGLVLFCKDIGQAMAPSPSLPLCKTWQEVPSDQYYFAAHSTCLLSFLDNRDKYSSSDRVVSELQQSLVYRHACTSKSCSELLILFESCGSQSSLWDMLQRWESGAFVFHARQSIVRTVSTYLGVTLHKKVRTIARSHRYFAHVNQGNERST